ncbi:YihY/virulence factor BrkB family protein [Sutcliffiella halmapala]|uniref:YihY/virulence factor BrkB family protein n=1 Tax=Sutcliffiella halmapala TaxID=79882 RepID=UPI0009950A50|nr:YihY/virulence factor BrkB family protein [Sutcliffiella halmapala]
MGIIMFVKHLYHRFERDEVLGRAAELAYFFLLSLFPFLIFLLTLIAYVPIKQEDVLGVIRQYAPGDTMRIIETNVLAILSEQHGGLLSFGIIATIWFASNGINAIVRAFNRAYDVNENRSFFMARGVAILLTLAMVFVIIIALLLPVFGREIGLFIFSSYGMSKEFLNVWNTFRFGVSFIILFFVFSCLYLAAPNVRLRIRDILIGSLFATVGWISVSTLFSYYVSNFGNYSAMYGSLGGIIVLLIWFYLSGLMIIIGGEINAIILQWRKSYLT